MKRAYIQPSTTEQYIQHLTILCGSDRIGSNNGIHGGDEGGDPNDAF